MAYRPPRRIAGARGTAVRRQTSNAGRIAIARATGRRKRSGGSALPLIAGLMVMTIVAITALSTVATGVGVSAAIAQMQSELPDPAAFDQLTFSQPTTVFDRTGQVQLAVFRQEQRQVVTFDSIPHLVLDATVSTEDHTFWTNQGYDPNAIGAAFLAYAGGGKGRGGASTITQQLVRARLLPRDLVNDSSRTEERKFKEILQASRLTDYVTKTYGTEEAGKERIIAAYLNQIFYGHNAYGVAAAANAYFGKTLDQLTPAEAATLAAIPKSPVCYDLYNWLPKDANGDVVKDAQGRLSVPLTGAVAPAGCDASTGTEDIISRRNRIIDFLTTGADPHTGRGFGRWTALTPAEAQAAKSEPIVLVGDQPTVFIAPHFVWAMRAQLDQFLADRDPAETGGYTVTTTLDMKAQTLAERYITAATIVPQLKGAAFSRAIKQFKLQRDQDWISVLRNKGIHNGALVAQDYSTGDILAYVGSAGYYRDDLASTKMNPKYDVAGTGFRQPGSAFKPIVYTTGFDERKLTPGSLLLDVTTPFARNWTPKDADLLERGPVLARKALQYSLNIPAMRALDRIGTTPVDQAAARGGLKFQPGTSIDRAGLAGAIGTVEVHMKDLVAMYGAFGDGGVVNEPRMILDVKDSSGNSIWNDTQPHSHKVWSPQAAWLMANVIEGNTNPKDNIVWGPRFRLDNGPNGQYRPAGLKTGTTNDVRDLSAYGMLAKPKDPNEPAIALGVWMGNSDHTPPTLGNAVVFASDGPGEVWHSWMREYMTGKPVTDFERPKGLVQTTIDAYSGGQPGPWTRQTTSEWFINGTQPGGQNAVDAAGALYTNICGTWAVDPVQAENQGAPSTWTTADRDWARRAMRGPGVGGSDGTRTAYFWTKNSWGGPVTDGQTCTAPSPTPSATGNTPPPTNTPTPTTPRHTPKPTPVRSPRPTATPAPPTATPTATPHPTHTPRPTPKPTKKPKPTPAPSGPPASAAAGNTNPSLPAADVPAFGVVAVAPPLPASPRHNVPFGTLGTFVPGIVESGASSPVRVGRRRKGRRRR